MSAPALALPRSLQENELILHPPSRQDVADLAYTLWQVRGSPFGSADEDWFEAERWLCAHRSSIAACVTKNAPVVVSSLLRIGGE
jgi:hypothetical protein